MTAPPIPRVPFRVLPMAAAGLAAAGLLAACAGPVEPRRVDAAAPTATYTYLNDAQLLAVHREAQDYCRRYQAVPALEGEVRTTRARGSTVTFRCHQVAGQAAAMMPAPINAPYRSDADLLETMHAADVQCAQAGFASTSQIVAQADGSRRVSVQCVERSAGTAAR